MTNPVRQSETSNVQGGLCPGCARMRRLVEGLVSAGVDWLDDCDAPGSDLEADDVDREVISEDDGVVDALTMGRALR